LNPPRLLNIKTQMLIRTNLGGTALLRYACSEDVVYLVPSSSPVLMDVRSNPAKVKDGTLYSK
jgi:hypothetical protein